MKENIAFIGVVHSRLTTLEECPLQEHENAPEARITILPEYMEGISNIQKGVELIVFTWLHRTDRTVLKTRPRNNPDAPLTGVFSTRSPDRPNPIGMHMVKVLDVSENEIQVSGLEVLDQTPVVDIKPQLF